VTFVLSRRILTHRDGDAAAPPTEPERVTEAA
jgi:hypothetical protein